MEKFPTPRKKKKFCVLIVFLGKILHLKKKKIFFKSPRSTLCDMQKV